MEQEAALCSAMRPRSHADDARFAPGCRPVGHAGFAASSCLSDSLDRQAFPTQQDHLIALKASHPALLVLVRSSGPPLRVGRSECHRLPLRLMSQGSLLPLHLTVSPLSSSASRQPTSAAVTEARCAPHSSKYGNACVTSGRHPCLRPLRQLRSRRRSSRITQDRSGTPGATSSSSVSSRVHAWLWHSSCRGSASSSTRRPRR